MHGREKYCRLLYDSEQLSSINFSGLGQAWAIAQSQKLSSSKLCRQLPRVWLSSLGFKFLHVKAQFVQLVGLGPKFESHPTPTYFQRILPLQQPPLHWLAAPTSGSLPCMNGSGQYVSLSLSLSLSCMLVSYYSSSYYYCYYCCYQHCRCHYHHHY